MNITTAEGLVAIKFESEDRGLIERAANAVVIYRAKKVTLETDPTKKAEVNADILAIAALTGRIRDNKAPVFATPVEGGLAISVGEEGSTVFQVDEVRTLGDVLIEYADNTVEVLPDYSRDALERARSGYLASAMAAELNRHIVTVVGG